MRKFLLTLVAGLTFTAAAHAQRQTSLYIDGGSGSFSTITGPAGGGSFSLPSGGGSLVTFTGGSASIPGTLSLGFNGLPVLSDIAGQLNILDGGNAGTMGSLTWSAGQFQTSGGLNITGVVAATNASNTLGGAFNGTVGASSQNTGQFTTLTATAGSNPVMTVAQTAGLPTGSVFVVTGGASTSGKLFTVANHGSQPYAQVSIGDPNNRGQLGLHNSSTAGIVTQLTSSETATTRNIAFPDNSGTVALTSDLGNYLPLGGGTMSGSIDMGGKDITNGAGFLGSSIAINYNAATNTTAIGTGTTSGGVTIGSASNATTIAGTFNVTSGLGTISASSNASGVLALSNGDGTAEQWNIASIGSSDLGTHAVDKGFGILDNGDGNYWLTITPGTGAVNMYGPLSMNTHKISGVVDPTLAQDAATKNYVDGLVSASTAAATTGQVAIYTSSTAIGGDAHITDATNTVTITGSTAVDINNSGTGPTTIGSAGAGAGGAVDIEVGNGNALTIGTSAGDNTATVAIGNPGTSNWSVSSAGAGLLTSLAINQAPGSDQLDVTGTTTLTNSGNTIPLTIANAGTANDLSANNWSVTKPGAGTFNAGLTIGTNAATQGTMKLWKGDAGGSYAILETAATAGNQPTYQLPNKASGTYTLATLSDLGAAGVNFDVASTQTASDGNFLFYLTDAPAGAAAAGAKIVSTGDGTDGAKGLTVTATGSGTDVVTGLSVSASGGATNHAITTTGDVVVSPNGTSFNEGISIDPSSDSYSEIFYRKTAGSSNASWYAGHMSDDNYAVGLQGLLGMSGTDGADRPFEIQNSGAAILAHTLTIYSGSGASDVLTLHSAGTGFDIVGTGTNWEMSRLGVLALGGSSATGTNIQKGSGAGNTVSLPTGSGPLSVVYSGTGTLSGSSTDITISGVLAGDITTVSYTGTPDGTVGTWLSATAGAGKVTVKSQGSTDDNTVNIIVVRP